MLNTPGPRGEWLVSDRLLRRADRGVVVLRWGALGSESVAAQWRRMPAAALRWAITRAGAHQHPHRQPAAGLAALPGERGLPCSTSAGGPCSGSWSAPAGSATS